MSDLNKYTESDLVSFGKYMLSDERTEKIQSIENIKEVFDSDLSKWREKFYKEKPETKTILDNGLEVAHRDVIIHTTTSVFGFWDRIKILCGRRLVINSEIFTSEDRVNVVASQAKPRVDRLIKRKPAFPGGAAILR